MTTTNNLRDYFGRTAPESHLLPRAELAAARRVWADFRAQCGLARLSPPLLTPPASNDKFGKSTTPIYGLSFAQSRESGHNVCRWSTPNCVRACVAKNGNGAFRGVQFARSVKVWFWLNHPTIFRALIGHEIAAAVLRHGSAEFRLNTFSDIDWQSELGAVFGIDGARFYDYTKNWTRAGSASYRLCYSVTERTSDADILAKLDAGHTVAMVVAVRGGKVRGTQELRPIPKQWRGYPVIDGDKQENRSLDAPGSVVMLRAKGRMFGLPMARPIESRVTIGKVVRSGSSSVLVTTSAAADGTTTAAAVTIGAAK